MSECAKPIPGPYRYYHHGHDCNGLDWAGSIWTETNEKSVAFIGQGCVRGEEQVIATLKLFAASSDLLTCQTMGQSLNTPDFLDWIADRMVGLYGESPNTDFVLSLRDRAAAGRAAIAKATGGA